MTHRFARTKAPINSLNDWNYNIEGFNSSGSSIQSSLGTNVSGKKCLDIANGYFANGVYPDLEGCHSTGNQRWVFTPNASNPATPGTGPGIGLSITNGTINNYGNPNYCLSAYSNAPNSKVQIQQCANDSKQQWVINNGGNGQISSVSYPGYCLDVPGGNDKLGAVPELYPCKNNGDANQYWLYQF
jgi:hypothetical protein